MSGLPGRRLAAAGVATLVVAAAAGGGAAVALAADDDPAPVAGRPTAARTDGSTGAGDIDDVGHGGHGGHREGAGAAGRRGGGRHRHAPQPAYEERYAAATPEEQATADALVEETRASVAAYADPADAEAAGYGPPRRAGGRFHHYLNRDLASDGDVLDPAHPEGLVYADGPDGPQLVGAFFVAQPGTPVPCDAGAVVTWHSHDPGCAAFWATADEPCTASRRMLHVWTAPGADLTRRNGDVVSVDVVDPFGAPFLASVERAG